jgi:spermidine synthase
MSLKDNLISLLSQLIPQELAVSSSPYNHKITIRKNFGRNELFVDDIRQSGGLIDVLWEETFKKVDPDIFKKAQKYIVLGIGGASVMKQIRKYNPNAVIDAVDIDPEIVKISRKYFDLDKYFLRKIISQDAQKFVNNYKGIQYDLIVIDLYIGNHVPDFVPTEKFLRGIKTIKSLSGHVLINYFDDTKQKGEIKMEVMLKKIFSKVIVYPVLTNTMFLVV